MTNSESYEFKYAPTKFEDVILSDANKKDLSKVLNKLPNTILHGTHGVGKGTFVDVMLKESGVEYLKINGSDETGVDVVRERIKPFATSAGFGQLKVVYINEADYLSLNAQGSLRDLMESVHEFTRFIFCCNYIHKMMPELLSRCQVYELSNPPAIDVVKRCWWVLDQEGVDYNKKTVVDLVKTVWAKQPDIRKALVTLYQNVDDGKLRDTIVYSASELIYEEIFQSMMSRDPSQVRKAVRSKSFDYGSMYKFLFDRVLTAEDDIFKNDAKAIVLFGEHDYRDNISANREINFITMYVKMMTEGVL